MGRIKSSKKNGGPRVKKADSLPCLGHREKNALQEKKGAVKRPDTPI